jgi:hypothetical protein
MSLSLFHCGDDYSVIVDLESRTSCCDKQVRLAHILGLHDAMP